jgi:hypothetical protein
MNNSIDNNLICVIINLINHSIVADTIAVVACQFLFEGFKQATRAIAHRLREQMRVKILEQ